MRYRSRLRLVYSVTTGFGADVHDELPAPVALAAPRPPRIQNAVRRRRHLEQRHQHGPVGPSLLKTPAQPLDQRARTILQCIVSELVDIQGGKSPVQHGKTLADAAEVAWHRERVQYSALAIRDREGEALIGPDPLDTYLVARFRERHEAALEARNMPSMPDARRAGGAHTRRDDLTRRDGRGRDRYL